MTQSFKIPSADNMICRFCGTTMSMVGIERDPDSLGMMLRTFECPHCRSLQTSSAPTPTRRSRNDFPSPVRLAEEQGFDDRALALLGSAFEAAWRTVESSGAPLDEDARERLAKLIIAQALDGERDEARIVNLALASFVANPDLSSKKTAA